MVPPVRDLIGDRTEDEWVPEALIIIPDLCHRRFPCVAIRRLRFIEFPPDQ